MDRHVVGVLLRAVANQLLVVGTHFRYLLEPGALTLGTKVQFHLFDLIDHLTQDQLGVADDADGGRYVPADPLGAGIDLNVRRFIAPGGWFAELLAAPELEADRQHHISTTSEGLFPRAAD